MSSAPRRLRIESSRIAPATARSARRGSRPGTRSRSCRSRSTSALLVRRSCFAGDPAVAQRGARRLMRSASATAPRLSIVPDVPTTRSKPARRIWSRYLPSSASRNRVELAFVARRQRIAFHEPLGEADDAELEAAADLHVGAGAPGNFDAAAADVDDDDGVAGRPDAVGGCLMDQARFFGAGNDLRTDACVLDDDFEELARRSGLRVSRWSRRR